jgi:hypothetical protein
MAPRHSPEEFTETLLREVTILQARFPDLADAVGRACGLLQDGRLFVEEDGRSAMVLGSDGHTWYAVNGACQCPSSTHRNELCKHRLALRLYQRVTDALYAEEEAYELAHNDYEEHAPQTTAIPPAYVTAIQGRPYVKFEGLLAMAHQQGLLALETTMVQATLDVAICQCVARFADGRVFCDIGDASPDNVAQHLRPHFIRMAATRASARALRRALNIAVCSLEELGQPEVRHGA